MRKAMRSSWLPVMPVHIANVEMLVAMHRLSAAEEGLLFRALRMAWAARAIGERADSYSDRVWAAITGAWESIEEARIEAEDIAERRRRQTAAARRVRASQRDCHSPCNRDCDRDCDSHSDRAILKQKTKDKRQEKILSAGTAELVRHGTPSQDVTLPRSPRSRRAPADFAPGDDHRRIALERGVDLHAELAAFRDHEFSVAKSDWAATFRNWLRRSRPAERPHPVDAQVRRFIAATSGPTAISREVGVWDALAEQAKG